MTADLLAHLAEVDARKLYLDQAWSSMFTYCVQHLKMSGPTAYKRIEAARTARRFPVIFEMVAAGQLHLTAVTLLTAKLTEDNHRELLVAAVDRSKREVEQLLASRFPQADVPSSMRKAPEQRAEPAPRSAHDPVPTAPAEPTASAPRPAVKPLSEERYYLKVTVSRAVHDKLVEAQELLRHSVPSGDLEQVITRAVDALLRDLKRSKFAETQVLHASPRAPKPGSRHIPNAVKREVAARDGHQCSFVGPDGRRCSERGMLEFHHVEPFARRGRHDPESIRLFCARHNAHAAVRDFGEEHVRRSREQAGRARNAGKTDSTPKNGPLPRQLSFDVLVDPGLCATTSRQSRAADIRRQLRAMIEGDRQMGQPRRDATGSSRMLWFWESS